MFIVLMVIFIARLVCVEGRGRLFTCEWHVT